MADVNFETQNTDQTSVSIFQKLKPIHVILITSRQIHQDTKPKGTINQAKFIKTCSQE